MKVICDNCSAVYRIPDDKLVKPVNKATCRRCGHRMLIPRPRKGAGPDEQTLVTSVPPTPAPVSRVDRPRVTTPIEDDAENTVPGPSTPVPAPYGTPAPRGRVEPPTVASDEPHDLLATPRPAPGRGGYDDQAYNEDRQVPARRPKTPAPAPVSVPPPPPASTPAPAPQPVAAAHDPSGDMIWALLGVSAALLGSLLLGVSTNRLVDVVGLMVALGGSFSALFVLVTSSRGRRPARPVLSVSVGTMLGLMVALTIGGLGFLMDNAEDFRTWIASSSAPPAAEPSVAPGTPTPAAAEDPEPAEDPVVASAPVKGKPPASAEIEPEVEPAPRSSGPSSSASSSPPSAASSPPPAATPPPTASTARASTPAAAPPPPPPPPAAPATVPYNVIDTILRNNIDIKKCFFNHMKTAGSLPARVDVSFVIEPTGKVSSAGVSQAEFAGSTLDGCLSSTIRALQFPPISGGAQKINYPFNLQ